MEKMHTTEGNERFKDFSTIEVQEVLIDGDTRAIIMPQLHGHIDRREGLFKKDPASDKLSLFTDQFGLSNYHPMGPDDLRPEIAEHFRMMRLDEIVSLLDSKEREASHVRGRLLMDYLLNSHLASTEAPANPHNGGWGGIMTNHTIRLSHQSLELAGFDELGLKRKYGANDDLEGLYSTPALEGGANIQVYDLSRLYEKYSPPTVTLRQVDKCCPDFTEELFKREFEELPLFLQDAFFDLPSEPSTSWEPLSLALSLRVNNPTDRDRLRLDYGNVEVASTCIGSINQMFAGKAWFISKEISAN